MFHKCNVRDCALSAKSVVIVFNDRSDALEKTMRVTVLSLLQSENKKFRLERDSNPCPLRYRCSALLPELSSQLGADHIVTA